MVGVFGPVPKALIRGALGDSVLVASAFDGDVARQSRWTGVRATVEIAREFLS